MILDLEPGINNFLMVFDIPQLFELSIKTPQVTVLGVLSNVALSWFTILRRAMFRQMKVVWSIVEKLGQVFVD